MNVDNTYRKHCSQTIDLLSLLKLNPNIPIIPLISKEFDEASFSFNYEYLRIIVKCKIKM